jgi:hypothetical protein
VNKTVTWDTARTDCLKRGGDLVIPTSNKECDLLSQRAKSLGMNIPWIGAQRSMISIMYRVYKKGYLTLTCYRVIACIYKSGKKLCSGNRP